MANPTDSTFDARKKYIRAWNDTMIDIWKDRIRLLGVVDTGALMRSPVQLPVRADGRFHEISLSQEFLEYGLWQDLGVGREVWHGNPGDIGYEKVRERRRWFSTKYYSSVMRLRDFMAESLGDEFKAMLLSALDSDNLRRSTTFYQRKGYS
ncbi:hypothetical protein [uncultured Duncaniella sp.]|uniref:hypothetical protein n=1 Tax=uncultured Duncaniella sp. TaxID=2768039 RepID=UPI00262EBB60|nr:hypothetical protein [uncultured Duncaniella sp.]